MGKHVRKYRRSIDLIAKLPPLFSTRDVYMIAGVEPKSTKTYLNRWVKDGYLLPFGGRTGLYFKGAEAKEKYYLLAIQKTYPGAVLADVNVLHDEGLTTQIPRVYNIVIPKRRKYPKIDDVVIHQRGKKWYDLVLNRSYLVHQKQMPTLIPEFALADMLKYKDGWVPDPDDIEVDELDYDLFVQACADLKTPLSLCEKFQENEWLRP